jgi:hypothetical protein
VPESGYIQDFALMCLRLAAECRGLADDVPEPELRTHWRAEPVSCIDCPALSDEWGRPILFPLPGASRHSLVFGLRFPTMQ